MRSLWLVARHQYETIVRRRAFLLLTLGFPFLIAAVMAIAFIFSTGRQDRRPIGYVDQAGILRPDALVDPELELRPFESLADARRALEVGEVQAAYLLPPDYLRSRRVVLYTWDSEPGDVVRREFTRLLRASLASDLPAELRERATKGASLVIRSADGRRQIGQDQWLSLVLPLVAGALFMVAIMTSAGYLLQAVTAEKENRTMEVMITSVTPGQLMGGKALGLMGVSMTQLLVWAASGAVAVWIATGVLGLVRLGQIPWSLLGVIALYFLPAFALVGGIMATIGSAVTEHRQGQQVAAVLNILFMMPLFLIALLLAQPNSPLMVAMTLVPTTAFLTVVLRWSVTFVPWWQMIASWLLLVASALLSVWCAARVMRIGLLRYGQRLDLAAVIAAVQGRS